MEVAIKGACNTWVNIFLLVYHSVVDKVEDDLKDAAHAGVHGDPQVDLISLGIGDVFLGLCPQESLQEVVSGVDLDH